LFNRIGSGYVYSDKFISDEEALEEYKRHLDGPNMVSIDPNRSKDLKFKKIDIKTGIHNKVWHKNCVGVGLAYGFIEPLESTGLLLVQDVLIKLTEILQKEIVSKWDVDSLNFVFKNKMDTFKKFIAYHYVLSSRRDTDYWRYVTENITINPELLELKQSSTDNSAEFAFSKLETNQFNNIAGGTIDIFTGMNHFPFTKISLEMSKIISGNPDFSWLKKLQGYWDLKNFNIKKVTNNSLSHYEFLKQNVHKNTTHIILGKFKI
jgi:tryptophan halogenase